MASLAGVVAPLSARAGAFAPGEVSIEVPVYAPSARIDAADERWRYRFKWSGLPVGEATITARRLGEAGSQRIGIELEGRTNAVIDLLWKYRLDARGTIRVEPFGPGTYFATESERGTEKLTRIEFGPDERVRTFRRKGEREQSFEFESAGTLDMLATVVLTLNLDYEVGQVLLFDTLTGTARYLVEVTIAEREPIDVLGRRVDAYRLGIATSELTDPDEEHKHRSTDLWVSATRPRRLLRARSKTFVGAIYAELAAIETVAGQGN